MRKSEQIWGAREDMFWTLRREGVHRPTIAAAGDHVLIYGFLTPDPHDWIKSVCR
jgi:hypothetical protein